eukprot:TRINITY_DN43087_c0_g1_i1.p1 TRINITY_DN43087_c0_g1~~TRINITY_DN43087_c0_g1_i1.p1  ORF type:complete len:252 (-),score=26.46 TRINITY_DN43087_c0_g1_i1:192-947(-)
MLFGIRPTALRVSRRLTPSLASVPSVNVGCTFEALVPESLPALRVSRRAGHNIKAPGVPWKIYHPHIQEPERKVTLRGSVSGPAKYIPKNYRHQQYIESIRSGEYLGEDYPFNFLSAPFWKARRYNVTYNPIPPDMSVMTGVNFHSRLNLWSVEWWEQERQRIKHFRAQRGFMKSKLIAEDFRRKLVQAGRVDNRRTERQVRMQHMAGEVRRKLMKKKFDVKDARRKGNSGTKQGPERKTREDYKRRGLLP